MIKPLILFLLLIFPCLLPTTSAIVAATEGEDVLLQLPIRIYGIAETTKPIPYLTTLKPENFSLLVNNQPRTITGITLKKESIGDIVTPSVPRFFALSFQTAGADPAFIQTVFAFIEQHIRPTDILLLRTPVDLYTIDTTHTDLLSGNIRSILENDLLQQQRDKTAAIEKLNALINGMELHMGKNQIGFRAAMLFAANFLEVWRQYYQRYLLADLESYSTFAARFVAGKGEKYVIHFQERAMIPLIKNFQNIATRLRTYAHAMTKKFPKDSTLLQETLDKSEQSMLFNRDFPIDQLLDTLLGVNIHCFLIFMETPATPISNTGEPTAALSVGYEKILNTIAHQTGGTAAIVADITALTQALQNIAGHTDYYYELIYPFDGLVTDQNLQVLLSPAPVGATSYYKKRFSKAELGWLKTQLDGQLLTISGITLAGNKLTFAAGGYALGTENSAVFPNLKVEIQLLDSTSTIVYQTAKVLQTKGATLTISLNLPPQYKGYYKLNIIVQDQTNNQNTSASQYIKLE